MKKVNIIAAGKIKEKCFIDAIDIYAKRLTRLCRLNIIEVPDYPDSVVSVKLEGEHMAKHLGAYNISLDIGGSLLSSEELSYTMDKAYISTPEINFFVGGSRGLCSTIKAKCNMSVSFGRVTYPHQLMRVILVEQVYRAFMISGGVSYHK